jgi:hypothetical protein
MNDIRENRAKMATPFVPGDPMRIWIQRQRECHSFAAQIAQAYPESEKVTAAVDALAVCGLYAPAIQRFLQVNPNPLLQTFDLLAVEVINHDDNLPRLATSATEGYGAAVRAEITPEQMEALATAVMSSMRMESTSEESLPTMIASAVRAEMKKVLSTQKERGARHKDAKVAPQSAPAPCAGYCWTHGDTFDGTAHNSANCRNPHRLHQTRATAKNRMGGA